MISDFPDADGLTGKDLAEVDLTSTEAQSTALRDDDGEIVEGIFERRQAAVGASRRLVELEVSAGMGDAPGNVTGLPQQLQTPGTTRFCSFLFRGSLLVREGSQNVTLVLELHISDLR